MLRRGSVCDSSFTQPCTPCTPTILPTGMRRSPLMPPASEPASGCSRSRLGSSGLDGLAVELVDLLAQLGTDADPMVNARGVDLHARLGTAGHRVVVPDTLDGAAVALVALVGHDDVVEGALLGATAGQTDL